MNAKQATEALNISNIHTQDNPRTLTILAPKTNIPIDILFEYVSPAQAKKWLEDNVINNRKISKRHVESYAKAMVNGNWDHSNGESIAFNQEGRLVNGQHRLQAVVLANQPVWMMVMYGVSKDAILTLDDGNARTLGDALTINGVKIKGRISSHASAVRVLSSLRDCFVEDISFDNVRSRRSVNNEHVSFYEKLKGYNEASNEMHDRWSLGEIEQVIPASTLIPIYYLFNDIMPEAVTEVYQTFFDKIPSGPLGKKSASWMVMRKLQRMKEDSVRLSIKEYINLLVWALINTNEQNPVSLVPSLGWQFKKDFEGRLTVKQKLQRT